MNRCGTPIQIKRQNVNSAPGDLCVPFPRTCVQGYAKGWGDSSGPPSEQIRRKRDISTKNDPLLISDMPGRCLL